jgi:uncharacterized protein
MIRESIVTTRDAHGGTHIAPMGVHVTGNALVIAPFKPSATLDNLLREPHACINYPDDVRVYAGCLTGRRDWPVCAAERIDGWRLVDCLAHAEVEIEHREDDELRPRFRCRVIHEANHAPFRGFNRAQAAVVELAILVSRLGRVPREKVERDIEYLQIAVDKTAGAREREAWEWLMEKIDTWRAEFEETSP